MRSHVLGRRAGRRLAVKRVHAAASLQDAHILQALLQADGIEVRVFNASAQGGLGEIPFTQTYPEIWVVHDEDAHRARAICSAYEAPAREGEDRACPICRQENPASFAMCWNCGADLDAA